MPLEEPDEIRLQLPADPQFARVARVAMAAAGVRVGLPVVAVEDLRIALDEALILLLRRLPVPAGDAESAEATETTDESTTESAEATAEPGTGDRAPGPVLCLTLHARPAALAMTVELVPAPPPRHDDEEDAAAERRFHELVPTRVAVDTVEPAAGLVRLVLR